MVRTLRPVSDPLGSYLRVGKLEHTFLTQMLVEGRSVGTGLVADPAWVDLHKDLWEAARSSGAETVLDSRSLDLSTPGGFTRGGAQSLPWSPEEPHVPADLNGPEGVRLCAQVAEMAAALQHSAVLAPTHLLAGAGDPWLDVDEKLVRQLRYSLSASGLGGVPIYYPLIAKGEQFYDPAWRRKIATRLASLPIDAVWLRIHPFGTPKSGPLVLQRYLAACRDLHSLKLPLVAEHTGSVGVALMAFGVVGGIESGITMVDHTDLATWWTPPTGGSGGGGEARIYLHQLGSFLDRSKARELFNRPGMKAAHACLDTNCCRRGWRDTLDSYREHFVYQRAAEVRALSQVPENLRAGHYMENFLRPATDKAVRAAALEPALEKVRKRLDSWRGTLGRDLSTRPSVTFSPPAAGRRLRRSA